MIDNILPSISAGIYQRICAVSALSTIPIIMVSGLKPDQQLEARAAVIQHFLPKPPAAGDLKAGIAVLLQPTVPTALAS